MSYTTRLFRTCQLLVQLTLKDKRCPPFLATAKIRYTRFRRPSSIAKFLHIARKRRRTHREPRQHCHLGKKLGHAKKRSGFTGSNGRRQDMTTTSETAMRRRMPSDSNSGALNLRVPSALGNRCDAHVFAPLSAPDRRISAFSPRRSQPRSLSGVEEGPRTISCPCGECNQVLWLSVWCSMPCPYVVGPRAPSAARRPRAKPWLQTASTPCLRSAVPPG